MYYFEYKDMYLRVMNFFIGLKVRESKIFFIYNIYL